MQTLPRKEREFFKREQEILQAVLELFDHEQWDKVTVAQIASHTGIGKGTIYKHFASKEDIYARLALDDLAKMLRELQMILGDGDTVTQVRQLLEFCFNYHRSNPVTDALHHYCKQLCTLGRISEPYQKGMESMNRAFMKLFSRPITQGIANGEMIDLPLETLFAGMHATFEGALVVLRNKEFLSHPLEGHCMTEDEFIDRTVDYMISTLIGKPATANADKD